jgi:hypothetical protein
MADTYSDIADASDSPSLTRRVAACASQQGQTVDPYGWAYTTRFGWAAAPGWGAAFASADAGGNPDPGADDAVVTDGMILSQVQAMLGAG